MSTADSGAAAPPRRFHFLIAAALLTLAGTAAYSNSFSVPFIFDDTDLIRENPAMKEIGNYWSAVTGRPVLGLTLVLNYHFAEREPLAYHVTNLVIHVLAALALYALIRRTLLLDSMRGKFGAAAAPLAFAVALLWMLHPLQTQSVTYIIQRGESLMGLFYILVIYCALRAYQSPWRIPWVALAAVFCVLGLGTKQVMVTAPVMVLVYFFVFLPESLRSVPMMWKASLALLFIAWGGLCAASAIGFGNQSAGFSMQQVTPMQYAVTQFGVIVHYLKLSVWPVGLCIDYTWLAAQTPGEIYPYAAIILALVAATVYGLIKRSPLGFLGAWFFLILAPTSSIMPIADAAVEHRMYLSLASIVALAVLGLYTLVLVPLEQRGSRGVALSGGGVALTATAVVLGVLTFSRNKDYESVLSIWQDTIAKRPFNPRAHTCVGTELARLKRSEEAIQHYQTALALKPDYFEALNNLGNAYIRTGKYAEAADCYKRAIIVKGEHADARSNYGAALFGQGRFDDGLEQYREAIRLAPNHYEGHNNLAVALKKMGRLDEAQIHFNEAKRLKPDYIPPHNILGSASPELTGVPVALVEAQAAVEREPNDPRAHYNLGVVYEGSSPQLAAASYEAALRLRPEYAEAHNNLGAIRARQGNVVSAYAHFREAVRLRPDYKMAVENFEKAQRMMPKDDDLPALRELSKRYANDPQAHYLLGSALVKSGKKDEGIASLKEAVRLKPDFVLAKKYLELLQAGSGDQKKPE